MKQLPPGDPNQDLVVRTAAPGGSPVRGGYYEIADPDSAAGPASGTLLEYWRILERRKGTLVLIAFLGAVAGALYTLPKTPVYQAQTTIEVQAINEDFMQMRNLSPTSNNSYMPELDIQTQIRILQSNALFERVTKKLEAANKPIVVQESRVAGWKKALGLPEPKQRNAREGAIAMAAAGVRVRAQANTRLVDISCDSTSPQLAADFVNTLTAEFIEENLDARWRTTQHTGEWLTRQLKDLKIKLEKSEEELQAYGRQAGLMFTQEKDNVTEQKLRQLQDELSRAQADRVAKQSRYEMASKAAAESLGEVLDSGLLQDYQKKLADLRRQHAELSASLTRSHPKVQKAEAQIQSIEAAITRERDNIVRRIKNDYDSAVRREKLLAADYASHSRLVTDQADKVSHYNILKREVDTNRQLYDNMLQRVNEAGVASALRASNVRVVDPATVPEFPYKPSLFKNTALGLFGGIFLGMAFIVFRERADCTVRDPGDTGNFLGVPELGIIPSASLDRSGKRPLAIRAPSIGRAEPSTRTELATWNRKGSIVAESVRTMLASLLFAGGGNGERPRVLVFSSAAPKEGKTTLCANLAAALGEINQRVLLIDADLRRPQLHRIFELDNEAGLVDLLKLTERIEKPLNGLARKTDVPNVSVLTSGPSVEGDPKLLYSQRLPELLASVRLEYDMVLIDTPPMLTMADARVIASAADAVVLVARSNQTSRESLRQAGQLFAEDGTRVLGAVLNDWNPRRSGRYGYYRYYDRYKNYYQSSGSKS